MTYEHGFEEHEEDLRRDSLRGGAPRAGEPREGATDEPEEDELLRVLLTEAAPEFDVTTALGDRVLAGATRRRARTRTFGGVGAFAALAVGVLAVAPLAGWGGHGSGTARATPAPGALAASSSAAPTSAPSASPSPSSSVPATPSGSATPTTPPGSTSRLTALPSASFTVTFTPPAYLPDWNSPKMKAVDRVAAALGSGHDNSYMGVGLTGQDFATGDYKPGAGTDASPIVVFRKPVSDPTLVHAAVKAAAPYSVVFQDTVLNASEQWFLGHRLEQDKDYWKAQGVTFLTGLQLNGTITISTADPAKVVPLLEQHYGYDGRVFVGQVWPPTGS
ncbi:hypothetical protein Caci_1735 [Catenulispora acidiphila DSM 44928]|uniref:Uncharacterized protein n=1 Tax=Catenulispora acidiphila (strain DSM 44928 / JCM 14897 / NBRC 102108 / NRRL B-24433 / ID139908) TaxID=479433 RepID=C7QCU6_CATAD|nr:hypothetical protein [Catenulispora acidiphila]ACU70656.1 hypothetical protein Caci_1735 [Catenulispora acidiphila DSM 44928]